MDGPAQPECAHRTMTELQGPRVNLAFRWITQHIESCPLTGVKYCALPSLCARFSRSWVPSGENKEGEMDSFLVGGSPCFYLGVVPSGARLD